VEQRRRYLLSHLHRNIASKICEIFHQKIQEIIQEQQDGDDSWNDSEISEEDDEESLADLDPEDEFQEDENESRVRLASCVSNIANSGLCRKLQLFHFHS
jgi:hypothetical protein